MHEHHPPRPVPRKIFTPGVCVLLAFVAMALGYSIYRFIFGIGSITNLDDQYPWGLWIAVDVATGVALAAGGFTTAALAHIFHRERYHAIVRPALLTALLGYTFVGLGLTVDLGRYYNIWHPIVPSMWSGHSVLFEVGMCVMAYLTVLYIEFWQIVVVEKFKDGANLPGPFKVFNPLIDFFVRISEKTFKRILTLFVIAGVVLSCMHQSSLGALMVIAPTKIHPLWYTPILPLLFLLSAISVGFPMVIFESMLASRSFRCPAEMNILGPLAKVIPLFLGIYLACKLGDLAIRDSLHYVVDGSTESKFFILEILLGVIVPMLMLLFRRVRQSPGLLFTSATLVVLGVALNRINVFIIAYTPVYKTEQYFPSFGEIAVTVGLISALIVIYRIIVIVFPVIAFPTEESS